jgi:hypothetical protein
MAVGCGGLLAMGQLNWVKTTRTKIMSVWATKESLFWFRHWAVKWVWHLKHAQLF